MARLPAGFVPSGTKYRKKGIQKALPCRRYGIILFPSGECSVPSASAEQLPPAAEASGGGLSARGRHGQCFPVALSTDISSLRDFNNSLRLAPDSDKSYPEGAGKLYCIQEVIPACAPGGKPSAPGLRPFLSVPAPGSAGGFVWKRRPSARWPLCLPVGRAWLRRARRLAPRPL